MKKIYLAGGMHKEWRETVIDRLGYWATFFDPTSTGLIDEKDYTKWDIDAVRDCDILFAYLEATNPSGLGMMLEIGIAYALNKTIIFVDEKPEVHRYTGMARVVSAYNATSLDEGISILNTLIMDAQS